MWQPTLVYTIGPIVLVSVWYYNSVGIVCPSKCILYIQLTQPSTQKAYYVQTLFIFNFWGSLYLVSFPIKFKLNTSQWAGHKASVLSCMHACIDRTPIPALVLKFSRFGLIPSSSTWWVLDICIHKKMINPTGTGILDKYVILSEKSSYFLNSSLVICGTQINIEIYFTLFRDCWFTLLFKNHVMF